ncbi:MAG: hypothetical protein KJ621_17075 [Proteobacteria bacterium]|nr:hypothetical protein [Pseudomonadota bacterium]MBU1742724.1 hypothetical protein [Pseudomonadota bacterium]
MPHLRPAFLVALSFMLLVAPVPAEPLDRVRAAEAALIRGDLQTALKLYNQIIAAGRLSRPDLAAVHVNRGIAYRRLKRPERAIALDHRYAKAYRNRAVVHKWLGQTDKARADWRQYKVLIGK